MPYLRIDESDMYSEIAGDGAPVLLLHGGYCSLESLRTPSEALIKDHRVYAYERPGHGRTADIEGDYAYSKMVADALTYLDAVGLSSAHIMGYSDGAIIGLLLAIQHPERVRSVVAISANLDPTGFTDSPGTALGPARQAAEKKPDLELMHYQRLSPDGPEHAETVLAKLFRLWRSEPHITPADLGRITAPVLVMAADRDTVRPDHTLLIAASIPGAQLCVVPGTTHALVAERPELISVVISGFLATAIQHESGGPPTGVMGPPADQ